MYAMSSTVQAILFNHIVNTLLHFTKLTDPLILFMFAEFSTVTINTFGLDFLVWTCLEFNKTT